jgi:uncharacterized membrane protein
MTHNKLGVAIALLLSAFLLAPSAVLADENFKITEVDFDEPAVAGSVVDVIVTLENFDAKLDVEKLEVKAWVEDQFGDRVTEKVMAGPLQVQQADERDVSVAVTLPYDLEEGDYTLVVSAEGRWEKTNERTSDRQEIVFEVEHLEDSLFVKEIRLSKEQFNAADNVDVAVTVANNGQDDQDNVRVSIAVAELGIRKEITLFGTLFADTTQDVYFTFKLPESAEGIMSLKATASSAVSTDVESTNLIVKSLTKLDLNSLPTAIVQKEMIAGQSETIQLSVTNRHDELKSYIVVSDASWIMPVQKSFDLVPGESATVTVELAPTTAGMQQGNIVVSEDEQPVSVVTVKANVASNTMSDIALLIMALIIIVAAVAAYISLKKGPKAETLYY